MAYILAVLMAALSFLGNRFLLKWIGPRAVVTVAPALEEIVKTLPAYYWQADILLTHAVFGLIEAGYDYMQSRKHKWGAAIASTAGHALFGITTVALLTISGSLLPALLSAYALHMGWNVIAVLINARRRKTS